MPPNASTVRLTSRSQSCGLVTSPADGERADSLGLALEHLAAAGEHGDVRPLLGERLGDRQPDPLRGPADDRSAALEP